MEVGEKEKGGERERQRKRGREEGHLGRGSDVTHKVAEKGERYV